MRDEDPYGTVLGVVARWAVREVDLRTERQEIDVFIEHADPRALVCRECGRTCSRYDTRRRRISPARSRIRPTVRTLGVRPSRRARIRWISLAPPSVRVLGAKLEDPEDHLSRGLHRYVPRPSRQVGKPPDTRLLEPGDPLLAGL